MISALRRLTLGVIATVAIHSAPAIAQDKAAATDVARGEVRVYVHDANGHPAAPASEGRVYLELKNGTRRLLKLTRRDATSETASRHAGGQLQRLRTGETIELVVLPPEEVAIHSATRAHLAAAADLAEYACPMKCALDVKPGDCPKCGMAMEPSLLEFEAVVALRFADEWQNAKGFRFPQFQTPHTLREALDKLVSLTGEVATLIESGKLERVHDPALNVAAIGKAIPRLANEANVNDPALQALAHTLTKLGPDMDRAADEGKAMRSLELLRELRSQVETFRAIVR